MGHAAAAFLAGVMAWGCEHEIMGNLAAVLLQTLGDKGHMLLSWRGLWPLTACSTAEELTFLGHDEMTGHCQRQSLAWSWPTQRQP